MDYRLKLLNEIRNQVIPKLYNYCMTDLCEKSATMIIIGIDTTITLEFNGSFLVARYDTNGEFGGLLGEWEISDPNFDIDMFIINFEKLIKDSIML